MRVVLVNFRADGERRSFSITKQVTVIGRRQDCDLRIGLAEVSRKHCRLVREDETIRIEDMGSSNGTYHNDERVHDATLSPGDRIQVGPVKFVVQIDGVPRESALGVDSPAREAGEPYDPISDFAIAVDRGDAEEKDDLVDFEIDRPTAPPKDEESPQ